MNGDRGREKERKEREKEREKRREKRRAHKRNSQGRTQFKTSCNLELEYLQRQTREPGRVCAPFLPPPVLLSPPLLVMLLVALAGSYILDAVHFALSLFHSRGHRQPPLKKLRPSARERECLFSFFSSSLSPVPHLFSPSSNLLLSLLLQLLVRRVPHKPLARASGNL